MNARTPPHLRVGVCSRMNGSARSAPLTVFEDRAAPIHNRPPTSAQVRSLAAEVRDHRLLKSCRGVRSVF